jgi:hypothetical protein
MSTPVIVIEQTKIVTPLGVRFWDVAMSAPAGGGLSVVAYRDDWPELTWNAVEGRNGVYSFRALPGLQYASSGMGDDAYWSTHPPNVPYLLSVTDPEDRYLPFQLSALLPCRGPIGIFASPLFTGLTPDPTWIPVFSLSSRPISGPVGAIRAQLQDDTTGLPASWATMTAQSTPGVAATGIADARGVISLALPYPEPRNFAFASPLGSSVKLTDQTWPVDISVFYTPSASKGPASTSLPFLEDLLQQGPAFAWANTAHSALGENFQLQFGNDLILRSLNSANGVQLPVLLVTPAGSPL